MLVPEKLLATTHYLGTALAILHNCPTGCPRLCEVDCRICKPPCACDRPGADCQDPRFSSVGFMALCFTFMARKIRNCVWSLISTFISMLILLARGAKREETSPGSNPLVSCSALISSILAQKGLPSGGNQLEHMLIKLDGKDVSLPVGEGQTWQPSEAGLNIRRQAKTNKVRLRVEGLLEIVARVVPITSEESRVHDVTEGDCFAHLELNSKFDSLSTMANGVLGQTYVPNYQSRVKLSVAMPVMGGAHKCYFSSLCLGLCGFQLLFEGEYA